MTDPASASPALTRMPTGIDGLDRVTHGGLFRGGVYMVVGRPGSGKTTFATQLCFHRARAGESVLYVTLLTETHGRLLANLQSFAFFEAAYIGRELHFVNGYSAIEEEGLEGLQRLLRHTTRERQAKLLVIDGMVTVEALATSQTAYKKFIQELQSWCDLVGCTVLILTSSQAVTIGPEHTMVDGIFELSTRAVGLRSVRELSVTKLRGSGQLEGGHAYRITPQGIRIFPRLEARTPVRRELPHPRARVSSGVPGLDPLLGGGLAPASLTLVAGPSGSGKTLAGLQFLAAGAASGERGVHFGFFEPPPQLVEKSRGFERPLDLDFERGPVRLVWQPMAEGLLDELGERLLAAVEEQEATRLFIDGLVGLAAATVDPERLAPFLSVLGAELRGRGVTALVSEQSRALVEPGLLATFDNIVLLQQVERESELVRLASVTKSRDSQHAPRTHRVEISSRGLAIGGPEGRRAAAAAGKPRPEGTSARKGSRP